MGFKNRTYENNIIREMIWEETDKVIGKKFERRKYGLDLTKTHCNRPWNSQTKKRGKEYRN